MSRRRTHRTAVRKQSLHGSRMWWATCSCGTWFQGWHHKPDALASAARHLKDVSALP